MANKYFYATQYSYEVEPVKLYGRLNIGAAGAVVAGKQGLGIKSIVKEATAGLYTIELADKFAQLLFVSTVLVDNAVNAVASIQVLEDPATIQADMKTDKKFQIQLLDFAGAAVNATSGAQVRFEITMRQSKIGRGD
jgi:hypothetical protein